MAARDDDPVVYLATAPNESIAQLWADVLSEAGIRAMLKPLGPGFGAWGSAWNLEHNIYVLRSKLAAAKTVIAELEPGNTEGDFV